MEINYTGRLIESVMLTLLLFSWLLKSQATLTGDPILAKITKDDSHFLNMPNEVMCMIMEYVDYFSLLKLPVVSREFKDWAEFYRQLYIRQPVDVTTQRKLINAVKNDDLPSLSQYLTDQVYDLEFPPIKVGVCENSILVRAVKVGNLDVVKKLVKHGAEVTSTAIETALNLRKLDIILFLLEMDSARKNVYPSQTVILQASRERWNSIEIMGLMLSDIVREGLNHADHYGRTAIHYATDISPVTVKLLLDAGADGNAVDFSGHNFLHRAVLKIDSQALRVAYVRLASKYEISINQSDWEGNTPLHLEVKRYDRQSLEVIRELVKYGADPNFLNKKGRSPIQIIRYRRSQEFVDVMLNTKSRVN